MYHWDSSCCGWYPLTVASRVVVGVLTWCILLYSVCDLKATPMNMQQKLNREFILYKFKLSHNPTEATKNICSEKSEDTVDHSIVMWWLKKFCIECKNIKDQIRSGKPKSVNSVVSLRAREANPVKSSQRLSGEFNISLSIGVHHLHDLRSGKIILPIAKILQN